MAIKTSFSLRLKSSISAHPFATLPFSSIHDSTQSRETILSERFPREKRLRGNCTLSKMNKISFWYKVASKTKVKLRQRLWWMKKSKRERRGLELKKLFPMEMFGKKLNETMKPTALHAINMNSYRLNSPPTSVMNPRIARKTNSTNATLNCLRPTEVSSHRPELYSDTSSVHEPRRESGEESQLSRESI